MCPQDPAFFCPALWPWKSSAPGLLTFGTIPSSRICKRVRRMASKWVIAGIFFYASWMYSLMSWWVNMRNLGFQKDVSTPMLQVHGQKAAWEDPVEWVRGTLPWPSAQQDQAKLTHLPPPTMAPGGVGPSEDRVGKENPPSSMESDPLVSNFLIFMTIFWNPLIPSVSLQFDAYISTPL